MTRHCAILIKYKEGKSLPVLQSTVSIRSVFLTVIFKAYKTFSLLCFEEKWRVQVHLVDMKKIDLKTK